MDVALVSTILTALGSVAGASATYWLTKQREREADLRKERQSYYKAFVESISGIMEGESTLVGQEAFGRSSNNLLLFAPEDVIQALYEFQEAISDTCSQQKHDELLTKLMLAIRNDLGIKPPHDRPYSARLWSMGKKRRRDDAPELLLMRTQSEQNPTINVSSS
jgi:hypothetical protein